MIRPSLLPILAAAGLALMAGWTAPAAARAVKYTAPAHGRAEAESKAPASAEECHETPAAIFRAVSPAVVYIATRTIIPYRTEDRVERAIGSGFIYDKSGLILTNSHVVHGAQDVTVTLDTGETRKGTIVGTDPIFDLAVVRIPKEAHETLPTVTLGDSASLEVGDPVVAIGNPFGLDQTLTRGIVSGLNRILPERPLSLSRPMIQTDAAINPGNSGGPLLNECGEAVGINTAIIPEAQNIGFAIPIGLVRSVLPDLVAKGRVVRPWIGFHGQYVDAKLGAQLHLPIVPGMLIEAVEPGSPAAKAKLHPGTLDVVIGGREYLFGGDIVTEINGVKLDSPDALDQTMQDLKVGATLRLKLTREGKTVAVDYTLPERPFLPGDAPQPGSEQ
ncbi:MAG TPA: trypsin-like peptidase domain-containing protein [Alphaproteobacteria bacterium]|nr:trypsin-like peptidase domain-containing protein [Alphaproteobacteria bacterium]